MTTQNGADMAANTSHENSCYPTRESEAFAASLRAWRLLRGITQDELADKSGVAKSTISMAERTFHKNPPKEIIQSRLASALGVTLNELRSMPTGFESSHPIKKPAAGQSNKPETMAMRGTHAIDASQYNQREVGAIVLPSKWVLGSSDYPGDLSYIVVSDSAMQPTLRSGDVAIIEPSSAINPGIYLVGQRDGESVIPLGIRRATPTPSGVIRISCDNERFDRASPAKTSDIVLLAKVVFVVRAIELE